MPSHAVWVRVSHWIVTAGVLTLGYTGFVILMAHPRLYWGDAGNDLTPALIELPISRNYQHGGWDETTPMFRDRVGGPVSANRTYDIFNKNGWGRSLHFLAAWVVVLASSVYWLLGLVRGHFRAHIWPLRAETRRPDYSLQQKCVYSLVVFVAAPVIALTGLTMSPAVTAAFPLLLRVFGGYQSARTIHFAAFVALALFVLVHVVMVVRSGLGRQLQAMTFGE
jgi:cytochrome b subunit of formate dehydrogenase